MVVIRWTHAGPRKGAKGIALPGVRTVARVRRRKRHELIEHRLVRRSLQVLEYRADQVGGIDQRERRRHA